MPLNLIRPQHFTSVLEALTDRDTVYVVPSFQRPYAWTTIQILDLLRDIEKASPNGVHYLSAIYLIPLKMAQTNDELAEFFDGNNKDLELLRQYAQNDVLQTHERILLKVYAVVDGQQRLTTLFLLAQIYAAIQQDRDFQSALTVRLQGGREVPRLIQNPTTDHEFMMSLVPRIFKGERPCAARQSQRRMLENVDAMKNWASSHLAELQFLASPDFKTSAIELEPRYGLTSFLTLNDRGKQLTVLEKLKSLLLQFSSDAHDVGLIHDLHAAFGSLYQILAGC